VSEKSSFSINPQQFYELHKKIEDLFKSFGIDPTPDSIAAREMLSEHADTIRSAYSYGTQLIEVASDNISAFAREIVEPLLSFALYPNTRSVLEAASKSMWLLDENISVSERISRVYAFRCHDLEQTIKLANYAHSQEMIEISTKRLREVIQKANKIGITKKDKNGETILINKMPNYTDMVETQLKQGEKYRILAGMAHAHNSFLVILGYQPVADIPSGKLLKKALKLEVVKNLAEIGLDAFRKQIVHKYKLFGWPIEGIESAFNETRKTLPQIFSG
jgi:hypothetical protein